MSDPAPIADALIGVDACYFCLGVSSVGMSEADYARVTFDLTLGFAKALAAASPQAVFCYVSGAGTPGEASVPAPDAVQGLRHGQRDPGAGDALRNPQATPGPVRRERGHKPLRQGGLNRGVAGSATENRFRGRRLPPAAGPALY
jgi:hypothetical protein